MSIYETSNFDWKHQGKRGFLLGTGPSIQIILDDYGFDPLFFRNEIVVGCKQICRDCPTDYMVSIDPWYYQKDYDYLKSQSFFKFIPDVFIKNADPKNDPGAIPLPYGREMSRDQLPTSFSQLNINAETGVVALRIAYLLGLNPIYILGCDAKMYKGKSHYHTDYTERRGNYGVPPGRDFYPCINELLKNGIQVFSCSPISQLNNVIPYVDIRTLF